jgi:23S rRNA (cytosine1962-C5)-methyltransferase
MAVQEDKLNMFRNRIRKVYKHLGRQARRLGISCWRLYDHDLPEFPFCIEIYNDCLYVAEYKRRHGMAVDEHEAWLSDCIKWLNEALDIPREKIFLKLRQRKPGRLGQYQRLKSEKNEKVVEENGLKFIVNLSDYLDTGLFLDHRITRQMVKEQSHNKKLLNLFAYTGAFSVYAAAGLAAEVITVDLSNTYLAWAQKNMALNGFTDRTRYQYVAADVKQYLKTLPPGSFDIIVMDPPTFSNSKKMGDDILDIQRDHAALINDCLRSLQPGGVLYFSTNYRKFRMDAEDIPAAYIKDITKKTTPFDFEGRIGRGCWELAIASTDF